MAQTGSVEAGTAAWRQWLAIGAGLLASWSWVLIVVTFAPDIFGGEATPGVYAAYTLTIYVPLLIVSLLAGWIGGTKVLTLGKYPLGWTVAGLVIGAAGLSVALAMSWLNGTAITGSAATGLTGLVAMGIALTLVQSAMEEVLFRGWLQTALSQRLGQIAGVCGSAVLFAGFHLVGGARQPLTLAFITLAGVLFGLLALRSGGILAPIAAHAAWNVTEDSIFGLVPNPGNEMLGSIMDFDLVGNPLWGGNEEGLNASIGAVLVIVAAILPLLAIRRAAPIVAPA
ncbi:MAG: CPBP family intramembrane glutamic endopeptidase [Novosphingobium sp.]|uniref:CPBP family intramembrane glutamic endopeptidase n=1 Tax=Novosphingobium sp. TaxID=1874826 RepID=UPI003B9CDF53